MRVFPPLGLCHLRAALRSDRGCLRRIAHGFISGLSAPCASIVFGAGLPRLPPTMGPPSRSRRSSARSLLAAVSTALLQLAGGGSVLMKGVTRNGLVTQGGSKFYRVQLTCPDTAEALQLSLTALQGAPVLYVSDTLQQPGPAVGASLNTSTTLTVDYPDAGLYYLAVYGATAAAYKLQAVVSLSTGARARAVAARRSAAAERAPRAPAPAPPPRREPALPGLPPAGRRLARSRVGQRPEPLRRRNRPDRAPQRHRRRLAHGAWRALRDARAPAAVCLAPGGWHRCDAPQCRLRAPDGRV